MTALTWHCQDCGKPVEDGAGYLHVDHTEIHQVKTEHDAFTKRTPGVIAGDTWNDFFALPDHATWDIHHQACDPDPESNDYWISVERIRTQGTMLAWTAHLMEKNWITYTNWIDLLRAQAGEEL